MFLPSLGLKWPKMALSPFIAAWVVRGGRGGGEVYTISAKFNYKQFEIKIPLHMTSRQLQTVHFLGWSVFTDQSIKGKTNCSLFTKSALGPCHILGS